MSAQYDDRIAVNQQFIAEAPPAIEEQFNDMQNRNEMAEVLKELFDEKKIYMIGDMTKEEIKIATRIYMIAELKHIESWKIALGFYVKFLLSKDRKSRRELLKAISGYREDEGLFNKMNPFKRQMI